MNHHDIFHEEKLARGKARYGNSFDESKIKRDSDGKFSTTGGGENVVSIKTGTSLAKNPKQKTELGKTESGKPIYAKARKSDYKGYSEDELTEVVQYLGMKQSQLSREYHDQHNGDGTFSKKHAAARKRIKKEIEAVAQQKGMVMDILEPSHTPDQRDFDRMDRKGDKDKRSKGWRKK